MTALGDRADPPRDRRPRLAFVLAHEDVAVRGAGEEDRAAGPDVQREPFDVAVDVRRQPAFEVLPVLAAVAAARDPRVGRLRAAPFARATDGPGDEDSVGLPGL